MISCTEFIPAYSELFIWLEKNYGKEAVTTYWSSLFDISAGNIPLVNFVRKEGIRGCFTYWKGTLNEEAADFTMYLNEKNGWFLIDMHSCPSKGKLLKLQEQFGYKPYRHYCLHCDNYRQAIESVGLKYIYNFIGEKHAACSILVYDPNIFDGRVIVDENTEVMDRRAADNDYFHPDFHTNMNAGVNYVATHYGEDALKDYLAQYAENVDKPLFDDIKKRGLAAIADKIRETYKKEKAEDALEMDISENALCVNIKYCPAVQHMKQSGKVPSKWYKYTTQTVMTVWAEKAGVDFEMLSYDDESGAAKYCFKK